MSDYLQKPMSVRQTQHVVKFLTVVYDLELISEAAFADTAVYFDDIVWDLEQISWEAPPPQWFASSVR